MLGLEFCIVKGQFSNLQYLMNSPVKSIMPRKWFLWKKLVQFSGHPGAKVRHQGPQGAARAQICIHNQEKQHGQGSVTKWPMSRTCNLAVSGSSSALATWGICSCLTWIQIFGHTCKEPACCLLPVSIFLILLCNI